MVILEQKDRVNAALEELFAAAGRRAAAPGLVSVAVVAATAEDTRALGVRLAGLLRAGDLVILSGDLGRRARPRSPRASAPGSGCAARSPRRPS